MLTDGIRLSIAAFAAAFACAACEAVTLESEAQRGAKGALVLQVGSDWCVSGEKIRKAFESPEFKRVAASKFALGIYDDMDEPTPAVKAKNEDVKSLLVRTKRFPALTCYSPAMKIYAQIENIPQSVGGERLAKAVLKQTKKREMAEALFKKAASAKGEEAADCYGRAFDILASMMGPFHFKELTTGPHGWTKEWGELVKLDAGDRYGWLAHFTMDEYETVRMVEKVTNLKEESRELAAKYVADVKKIPQTHMTPNQKQCVLVMEYALSAENGTRGKLSTSDRQLLKEAFELGRETFWGQFAMGRLMMDGEKIESRGLPAAKVVPRPSRSSGGVPPPFILEQVKSSIKSIKPGTHLSEQQKLAIARYAALRLIGQKGWADLVARPGSAQFVKAFMNDRVWLEDFAWSGTFPESSSDAWAPASTDPGAGAGAILALESLVYQDKGRWTEFDGAKYEDNEGRRFMTALALNFPDKDEAWLADVLDAYRTTALSGRLHKSAYTQPVWMWRFATHQGHGSSSTDNMAAQQRHLDKFVFIPQRELGGTPWMITYRLKNCFGDSVHGPYYYKAWATAGEWPKRKYSQIVGGVCGELSKFGSAICNAHGLPSTTVGQPGHCAFSRRLTSGKWEIDYSVTGHSQMHLCFWNKHPWQYVAAIESMFGAERETRLAADRILALATLADEMKRDDKTIEKYYQSACVAHRGHYGAWHDYGDWLMRTGKSLDQIRIWVKGCAKGLKAGRQPLWDILTPYFKRVAAEKGPAALRDDLVEFAPLLRQNPDKLQEEADFKTNLVAWTEALGSDRQARYDVLRAMLAAQFGTADYFSQTMGWGSDYFTKTSDGAKEFNKCLNEALADCAKSGNAAAASSGGKIDFGPLILSASKNGNLGAFQQMVKLQKKMAPPAASGQPYAKNDFGGELLSPGGMLQTSSTCGYDRPERYICCIDESACGQGSFHTDSEESPWALVTLAGPTDVAGIVVENRFGGINSSRQVPIVVEISADNQAWTEVFASDSRQDTYRIDLRGRSNNTRYVRVKRRPGARKEFFHLNKILVYGRKLY